MGRLAASLLIAFALPALAADEFPLKLQVLGTSDRTQEYKRLYADPCIKAALGAPCRSYEDIASIPGWAIDVLQVTARLTQRGRTTQYELVCKSAAPKRPCAPMQRGEYPARWRGKKLEVLVTGGRGKAAINRFVVKGERDAD